ncbi:MAG: hypothetical protein MHM6MM_005350 [Cercozoa sp. M6MM]
MCSDRYFNHLVQGARVDSFVPTWTMTYFCTSTQPTCSHCDVAVGAVFCDKSDSAQAEVSLRALGMLPIVQGRGLEQKLLEKCLHRLRDDGAKSVIIDVETASVTESFRANDFAVLREVGFERKDDSSVFACNTRPRRN